MRNLFFVTSSESKFKEVAAHVPGVRWQDMDLPEIQELDPEEVVYFKLRAARYQTEARIMVEDTSLSLRCLGGFPGPLVKWLDRAMGGPEGLFKIASAMGDWAAVATTVIGYMQGEDDPEYFRGDVSGTIVSPRGETGFCWDTVFQPDNHALTYAEMGIEEKNKISHRHIALDKLVRRLGQA